MPRIRSLKPEHRAHRKVGPLSDREYRLWVSMVLESDDEGRFLCDASQLRAQTWPYHDIDLTEVEAAIQAVAKLKSIRLYRVGKTRYGCFPSWGDHQHPKYPQKSTTPPPPFPHHSANGSAQVRKRSTGSREGLSSAELKGDMSSRGESRGEGPAGDVVTGSRPDDDVMQHLSPGARARVQESIARRGKDEPAR